MEIIINYPNHQMNQYTFENKLDALKQLGNLDIPELSNIFNLNDNPYYFESITETENNYINKLTFKNKQALIKQLNPNLVLKLGDKIVEYWVDGTVENVGAKTFNWAYFSNPFTINYNQITQVKFFDLVQLKQKLLVHKSRYFYVELTANHINTIFICFDVQLKEMFYICFSNFVLDLDEYDFVQAVSHFSAETGYGFNSDKVIMLTDANNPDSILLMGYLLAVIKTSDLHKSIEKIIAGGETSSVGYVILKTWLWYNYIMETTDDLLVAPEA